MEERSTRLEDASCEERYADPARIDQLSASCDEHDRWGVVLQTRGWASRAVITLAGTAAQALWNEDHALDGGDFDPCGAWDRLEADAIETESDAWRSGQQTVFSCWQLQQLPPVLTRVVRLYALDGSLVECLASGHDPEGLLGGAYDDALPNPIEHRTELERCLVIDPLPGQTPTW